MMSTNTDAKQDPEVVNSWNKFAETAKKAGYRDGAADGKEKVFQKSFDEGYIQGFRIGFALGQYKGVLQSNSILNESELEYTRRGLCEICNKVTGDSIQELILKQTEVSNNVLKNLHSKYSTCSNMKLKDQL